MESVGKVKSKTANSNTEEYKAIEQAYNGIREIAKQAHISEELFRNNIEDSIQLAIKQSINHPEKFLSDLKNLSDGLLCQTMINYIDNTNKSLFSKAIHDSYIFTDGAQVFVFTSFKDDEDFSSQVTYQQLINTYQGILSKGLTFVKIYILTKTGLSKLYPKLKAKYGKENSLSSFKSGVPK